MSWVEDLDNMKWAVDLEVKHRGGGEKDIDSRQQSKKRCLNETEMEKCIQTIIWTYKLGVAEYKNNILGSKTVPTVLCVLDKPVYWSKIMHTIKKERY